MHDKGIITGVNYSKLIHTVKPIPLKVGDPFCKASTI